jgi:polyisoprenoid-binding protein YceI
LLAALLFGLLAAPVPAAADTITWNIDTNHSEISFRVRHFVTKVPGTFTSWRGTIRADPADLALGAVEVTIDVASVSTKNERRDNDLRSSNFFSADSFPTMTFKSTRVEVDGSAIRVTGDLTMRGVTRSVTLTGEYAGTFGPPEPRRQRIGFSVGTKLDRRDYGLVWNRLVEGSNMLGDDVEITINIEAVRAA